MDRIFLPLNTLVQGTLQGNLPGLSESDGLDGIWIEPPAITNDEGILRFSSALLFERSIELSIPGLDAVAIVLFPGGEESTEVPLDLQLQPECFAQVNMPIALRLRSDLLVPARRIPADDAEQHDRFERDQDQEFLDINLADITLRLDLEGNFDIEARCSIDLPPCMIGDSGVVIEASDIGIYLGHTSPPGKPEGWRGLYFAHAALYLPADLAQSLGALTIENCYIGNGGFSGSLTNSWAPALSTSLGGMELGLKSVGLTFVQNALTESGISGVITLPFFDEPIDVEVGIDFDGGFSLTLGGEDGIYTFRRENLLEMEVESLGVELEKGVATFKLGGSVKPLFGNFDWPSFKIDELSIDSEGNVKYEGGWIDLPDQYSLDFNGFNIEITQLGFGKSDDGGKWIGFSGALNLVEGLTAGASVEGLRITWYDDGTDPKITLEGVEVEFEVPDVLRFQGSVSYRELDRDGEKIHRFDGDITLDLMALDLQIDATLVIGSSHGDSGAYTFFAIYLGVELPTGIPLWSTGLGLYGAAGLFALYMEPDKKPDEEWYGMGPGEGWFKRPEIGVADLDNKWTNCRGSLALGAGVTIGTLSDNGYIFSGKVLLAIVFPGPIILIEGKASLLRERSTLDEEPVFRALAVLDFRAGTFLIGLDAQYKYDEDEGRIIDIAGSAEIFFSFTDLAAWHLYLGEKEPREKRIQAEIISFIKANAYFMLDARQIATGAWIGFDKNWRFGPVRIALEAWLEGNVIISWKPSFFHGDIWLHGKLEISIFGIGLGISADVRFACDVYDPYHILAEFKIALTLLFWDLDIGFTLEWGPEPIPPQIPLPLKEVAIEHPKVSTSWPLPRGELLLPNYDKDGFRQDPDIEPVVIDGMSPEELSEAIPTMPLIPIVPLDCRPCLTFGRPVHDDALIGVNPQPVDPESEYERIGDPEKDEGPVRVRYGLKEVALDKLVGGSWIQVAHNNVSGVGHLYGSWAPLPSDDGKSTAQTKLMLWSKTPFDYTRQTGSSYNEWFTDRFSGYPCLPIPPNQEFCYDFERLMLGHGLSSPWAHPAEADLTFYWNTPDDPIVTTLSTPVAGRFKALCFQQPDEGNRNEIIIHLPQVAKSVKVISAVKTVQSPGPSGGQNYIKVTGYDQEGQPVDDAIGGGLSPPILEVTNGGITHVSVFSERAICLVAICITVGPNKREVMLREEMEQHMRNELALWSQTGDVLEPHTTYRLKVVTTIQAQGESELKYYSADECQTEFAYFRTDGPPGLTRLALPIGASLEAAQRDKDNKLITIDSYGNLGNIDESELERLDEDPKRHLLLASGLTDLAPYVLQTIPATVPAPGEKPPLPRPVYCAYDVGVEFNSDYVDLMYRLERRDLGLYLYDSNNRPVRDAQGRLIILSNYWGKNELLLLVESEQCWITAINASDCAILPPETISHTAVLTSDTKGQVLEPDTLYEARLVPLILHEDFSIFPVRTTVSGPNGTLGRWTVLDQGSNEGSSRWQILEDGLLSSRFIIQTSNIWGGARDPRLPAKPGALLLYANNPALPADHPEQPSRWTDYRMSVYLRSIDDDAIGVVFRYLNASSYYLFSMDRQGEYRRLVRITNGVYTILAEDDFIYAQDQDYLITVEAVGPLLKIYQDGELVFDVAETGDAILSGSIGLYCWANQGARFSDVRIDDYRKEAPVVYKFKFTTSQFANFFHHLHSYQDETWLANLSTPPSTSAATEISTWLNEAVEAAGAAASTEPSEKEARAYDSLAEAVLGSASLQNPAQVEVTQVVGAGMDPENEALAFLVRSPEPIDWKRTSLELWYADRWLPLPKPPGTVKLTDVTFKTTPPTEETVTLLLREATDLTGYGIEYRQMPGPIHEPVLLADEFEDSSRGLLFREVFDPNALDHYTIVDQGTHLDPSSWSVRDGHIVQTSGIYGGSLQRRELEKPGTMALTGSTVWADVIIRATLRSEGNDALGVVFRYRDPDNYYRFSVDAQRHYRRLIKKANGIVSVLWEDSFTYKRGRSYRLVIEAYQGRLLGFLNDIFLFHVQDEGFDTGQVGFYCWNNRAAHFEALEIERLEVDPLLWQPHFDDLGELTMVDEEGTVQGPSAWRAEDGVLVQSSNIHMPNRSAYQRGTYAWGGRPDWSDLQVSVRLRSDDGSAIGVMIRLKDGSNYYRFSMDNLEGCRRLVKVVDGSVTILWQDSERYIAGKRYELTLRVVGSNLRGFLDGTPIFAVYDSSLKCGRIGLCCWDSATARFERVVVLDQTRRIGQWRIVDEGTVEGSSFWQISAGALLQTSNIHDGIQAARDLAKQGTYVISGSSAWTDYRITVRMRSDDNDAIGLIFRYVDEDNYYRLSLDHQRSYRRLVRRAHGVVTTLWEDAGTFEVGMPFTLAVDAVGSRLMGYMNERLLFEVTDSTHAAGQIGLYCWGNIGARFEFVEVRSLTLEANALFSDRFAEDNFDVWTDVWAIINAEQEDGVEDEPSDWIVEEGALHQRGNIWTKPNDRDTLSKKGTHALAGDPEWTDIVFSLRLRSLDDDALGVLFRYTDEQHYYRFSMDAQRHYRRLVKNVGGTLHLLWEDASTYETDRSYELTIIAIGSMLRGYMDGIPMFIVEDGDLLHGCIGLYCWANEDAWFSNVHVYPPNVVSQEWMLDEPFEMLVPTRWTFFNDGELEGPSCWEVRDGELRQTSNISKFGTYALAGETTWQDYRFLARLRSDGSGALGAVFRYRDANNHYCFSMDRSHRYRRLTKKVAGMSTVLWEDTVQYMVGREYVLTLDCVGEQLRGYIDGVLIFDVVDSELSVGCIGLCGWGNLDARFSEVRVAEPVWMPYYRFGRKNRLPAGTRILICAGNEAGALDKVGRPRLPSEGTDLRLVSSDAKVEHARRFLPDSAFTTIDASLLRKSDGTAFFIMAPSLSAGQYRLKMKYRRNNRNVDPNSQIYSEAGYKGSEEAIIDVPWGQSTH